MENIRRLPKLFACGLLLLHLLPLLAVAQDGRPVVGREKARAVHDAAEEVGRRNERRKEEQRTERQSEDKRRPEERRADEARRAEIDAVASKIDLTKEYNKDKLDFDALARKIEADQRRRKESDIGQDTEGFRSRVERHENRPTEVVTRGAVDLAKFERLNVTDDPKVGKKRPGEAAAAAEFESYWGSRLERSPNVGDFLIKEGRDKGKIVDFMLTPDRAAQWDAINKYFEGNIKKTENELFDHTQIADIVPIDTRFLTTENKIYLRKSLKICP